MKKINTKDAIGMVLAHDLTEIIPGKSKGAAFRKGHVVREEDIPRLLNMGKEQLYILELSENELHENEAAVTMAESLAGDCVKWSEPMEGKSTLTSSIHGLLKVNKEALDRLNGIGPLMVATQPGNVIVSQGDKLAGTRIIPLVIDRRMVDRFIAICEEYDPVLTVRPFKKVKVGIVTTGSEVYKGRITDKFGPVIKDKVMSYGSEVIDQIIVDDDEEMIRQAIVTLIDKGADMIACTGGMSVDPDDVTPTAIEGTGAKIVSYGAPVLPGSMFMLAYHGDIPIVGLPGCVMYSRRTVFDLVLPRILVGERLDKEDIIQLGYGGLCLNCDVCTFPNCNFGKNGG